MHFKMLSAKWRPFCLGLNVLIYPEAVLIVVTFPGYVCERKEVKVGGCCDVDAASTQRYMCSSCQNNGCCTTYEHCVSCCMQPEKVQKPCQLSACIWPSWVTIGAIQNLVSQQYGHDGDSVLVWHRQGMKTLTQWPCRI